MRHFARDSDGSAPGGHFAAKAADLSQFGRIVAPVARWAEDGWI
jgi:hypothetical protein